MWRQLSGCSIASGQKGGSLPLLGINRTRSRRERQEKRRRKRHKEEEGQRGERRQQRAADREEREDRQESRGERGKGSRKGGGRESSVGSYAFCRDCEPVDLFGVWKLIILEDFFDNDLKFDLLE